MIPCHHNVNSNNTAEYTLHVIQSVCMSWITRIKMQDLENFAYVNKTDTTVVVSCKKYSLKLFFPKLQDQIYNKKG